MSDTNDETIIVNGVRCRWEYEPGPVLVPVEESSTLRDDVAAENEALRKRVAELEAGNSCQCGCGGAVLVRRFIRGHNRRKCWPLPQEPRRRGPRPRPAGADPVASAVLDGGRTITEVARECGTSRQAVSQRVSRERWRRQNDT